MRFSFASLAATTALTLAVHIAAAQPTCEGDCSGNGQVTVDELVRGVNIALGNVPVSTCAAFDTDLDGQVAINELIAAVGRALAGCPRCEHYSRLRNAFFGDLHVHTLNSFDAYGFDVRVTPEQAYGFAQGDPIELPPLDSEGHGTRSLRIDRPLDFAAVTDHSEFLGEVSICTKPGLPGHDSPTCQIYRQGGNAAVSRFGTKLTFEQPRFPDVCGPGGENCFPPAMDVWERIQQAAAAAYDRSPQCRFTTFVAYEYSAAPGISTLHRNVIFRNENVPLPISFFEQPTPQGLWAELDAQCLKAGNGCDVLAIPHNSNESNGKMFFVEYPGAQSTAEERAQAAFRAHMEPLVEIYQHKGDSECMNGLSGFVGAPDELCEFEKRRKPPFEDCGDLTGALGITNSGCISRNDFVRGALLTGLKEKARLGVNPYRLGIIASTDTHNGAPGAVEESGFIGHRGLDDDTIEKQLGPGQLTAGGIIYSPGGLVGVWAEENTRESIFDALRRRETFGTSGPRITVRFFGGWNLSVGLCDDPQMVARAYASGVPMGSKLPTRPAGSSPSFLVSALRDPGTDERPGTPLQRLQIIKGWLENGDAHYRVHDVVYDAENVAGVDLQTCETFGSGADFLCAVWTDPDFDPEQEAFYYARVLENPTCRWNMYVCNRLPPAKRHPSCSDPAVPKVIQERAWASPIWYER